MNRPSQSPPLTTEKASLPHGIADIIQLSARKQMARILALPVVAFVKNKFSFRNRTNLQLVRHAMSSKISPLEFDSAVSVPFDRSQPNPAPSQVRSVLWDRSVSSNPFPKSGCKCCNHIQPLGHSSPAANFNSGHS